MHHGERGARDEKTASSVRTTPVVTDSEVTPAPQLGPVLERLVEVFTITERRLERR